MVRAICIYCSDSLVLVGLETEVPSFNRGTSTVVRGLVIGTSWCGNSARFQPKFGVVLGFIGVEFGFVAKGEADVIESVKQAVFAEGIDVEVGAEAFVVGDGLGFEVDGDLVCWIFCGAIHQGLYVSF